MGARHFRPVYVFRAEDEEKGEKPDNVPDAAVALPDESGVVRARRAGEAASATDIVPGLTNAAAPQPATDEGAANGDTPADGGPAAGRNQTGHRAVDAGNRDIAARRSGGRRSSR